MAKSEHTLIYQIPFPAGAWSSRLASLSAAQRAGFQLWTEARLPGAPLPTGGKVRREGAHGLSGGGEGGQETLAKPRGERSLC